MTIKEKISRLSAINLNRLFDGIIKDNHIELIQMNRDQMYEDGTLDIRSFGGKERYAPATIKAKRKASFPKTEFITLKWDGDFHNSVRIKISNDSIEFVSDDPKWVKWLSTQDRFERALGLTNESLAKLRDIVKEGMIKELKNVI